MIENWKASDGACNNILSFFSHGTPLNNITFIVQTCWNEQVEPLLLQWRCLDIWSGYLLDDFQRRCFKLIPSEMRICADTRDLLQLLYLSNTLETPQSLPGRVIRGGPGTAAVDGWMDRQTLILLAPITVVSGYFIYLVQLLLGGRWLLMAL